MDAQITTYCGRVASLIITVLCWIMLSPSLAAEDPPITAGRLEFQKNCASCHGIGAKGDGPMKGQLKKEPADLTQISIRNGGEFPLARIYRMIDGREPIEAHGSREMPIWGDQFLEEEGTTLGAEGRTRGRLSTLVVYLQSIQEQ